MYTNKTGVDVAWKHKKNQFAPKYWNSIKVLHQIKHHSSEPNLEASLF